jgi:hypothetical protein
MPISDTGKERIGKHEDMSLEIFQVERQREKIMKNEEKYPRTVGQLQKVQYE